MQQTENKLLHINLTAITENRMLHVFPKLLTRNLLPIYFRGVTLKSVVLSKGKDGKCRRALCETIVHQEACSFDILMVSKLLFQAC